MQGNGNEYLVSNQKRDSMNDTKQPNLVSDGFRGLISEKHKDIIYGKTS